MDSGAGGTGHLAAGRLQQLNRLATIARLVAGLAHELNNSLQVISGLVELLSDRADLPPDALVRIQKIGGQADKATGAVRQVLGFSREMTPRRSQFDLGAIVEEAVTVRRYNLGRAAITVSVEIPPGAFLRVSGDDRELTQVLLNLVLNAEEALANQPQRQLRIGVTGRDGRAHVAVSDTGHGVAPEIRDRIFEPYFTTRDGERTLGLGLTVARQLAERQGGALVLADGSPGSTTFVLEVPLLV